MKDEKPQAIKRMPILRDVMGDKYYFGISETQMIEIDVSPNFDNSQVAVKLVDSRINELVQTGKAKLMDVVTAKQIEDGGFQTPQLQKLAEEVFSIPYQEQE